MATYISILRGINVGGSRKLKMDHLHVTLLSTNPDPDKFSKIKNESFYPIEFRLLGTAVYLYCPEGYGKSKLTNEFLERKLGLKATTRNWRTMTELIQMAEKY